MADASLTLGQLLAAEDDAAILEFKCSTTGILLWPLIRVMFFRIMMSDLHYGMPLVSFGSATTNVPKRAALVTLAKSLSHNLAFFASDRARAEICLLTDALGVTQEDGKWFNRLSDHFALLREEQTLVIEEQWAWAWKMPRRVSRLLFHAPWQVSHMLIGRALVRERHRRTAASLIDFAANRARKQLGWDLNASRRRQLVEMLATKLAGLPHRVRSYRALLKRINPRVLLIDSGCYGNSSALIAAAREHGSITAEFQHGAVSAGHDGYNIAEQLRSSPAYRSAIPDHFLAFGKWWADQINMPVNKVIVGSPHRAAQLRKVTRTPGLHHDVLLLGDGIESEKYLAFAAEMAAALSGTQWRVVFRPHPLERELVKKRLPTGNAGTAIDENPDIYDSLAAAGVVISEQSSGLFEAIGLADRIFVWKTSKAAFGFPVHPFASVSSAEELAVALGSDMAGLVADESVDAIWAADWEGRYIAFLNSCGVS